MTWTAAQKEAVKAVLLDWHNLSLGDISVICAMLREPGAIQTIGDTPPARFWSNMVTMHWAEKLYSIIDPESVDHEPLSFALTEEGQANLPYCLIHYDLLNMGAATPSAKGSRDPTASKPRRPATPDASLTIKFWALAATALVGVAVGAKLSY